MDINQTGEGTITDVFFEPISDNIQVNHGQTVGLFVAAATGYSLASAEGCGGLTQNPIPGSIGLVSEPVVEDCAIEIVFEINTYQITTSADNGGSWDLESAEFTHGQEEPIEFTLTVPEGYEVNSVTGCDYEVSGAVYAVSGITADCSLDATLRLQIDAPTVTTINPSESAITLVWTAVTDADAYKIYYAKETIADVENYASLEGSGVESFNDTIGSILGLENDVEYFFPCHHCARWALRVMGQLLKFDCYDLRQGAGAADRWSLQTTLVATTLCMLRRSANVGFPNFTGR